MKFQILPSAQMTIIINKSNKAFFEAMGKIFNNNMACNTKLVSSVNYFIIRRTLNLSSRTLISTEGLIVESSKGKSVSLKIKVTNSSRVIESIILYLYCTVFFILMLINLIKEHQFSWYILAPILFMLLGYGVLIISLRGALDELIDEIKKAAQ